MRLIDAACGGSIEDKTPQAIKDLISTMVATSKQYGDQREPPRRVNKVSTSSLASQIADLISVVWSLVVGQTQQDPVGSIHGRTSN